MRVALRILGVVLLLVILLLGAVMAASELGGEIVVLRTGGAGGETLETRLWVVDHQGAQWLRGGAGSGWLTRIEEDPDVVMVRRGQAEPYRALPVRDAAVRDRIEALMAEKYGFADRLIALVRDPEGSVAVRLDPLSAG
jgi:hypothetical protein